MLAANPRSELDLQLAGELLLSTDPKRAIEYLQRSEAVKSSPRTELCWPAHMNERGRRAAHKMLEKRRRSAPTNPEVLRAVASYYRDTGHYEDAIRILENLHTQRPEHPGGTGILLRAGRQCPRRGSQLCAAAAARRET